MPDLLETSLGFHKSSQFGPGCTQGPLLPCVHGGCHIGTLFSHSRPVPDHREVSWMLLTVAGWPLLRLRPDHGVKECGWPVGGVRGPHQGSENEPSTFGDLALSCVGQTLASEQSSLWWLSWLCWYEKSESFPQEPSELNVFAIRILNKPRGPNMLVYYFLGSRSLINNVLVFFWEIALNSVGLEEESEGKMSC